MTESASPDDTQQFILQVLAQKPRIRLQNLYKGMPISNEAEVTEVDGETVLVKSNRYQVVCMYLDHETFLQCLELPHIVHCRVLQLNPTSMEVRIAHFEYVKKGIGERRQVRVEATDAINSVIQSKNASGVMKAELADLSPSGVAIYVPRKAFLSDAFQVGAEMTVTLTLPMVNILSYSNPSGASSGEGGIARFGRDALRGNAVTSMGDVAGSGRKAQTVQLDKPELKLRAVVMNVRMETLLNRVRVGMRIYPTVSDQVILSNFISQRQGEIIREVRDLHSVLFKF